MRRLRWLNILSVLVAAPAASQSAAGAPPIDPLVAVVDAEPLELGRVARRLGDVAVIARLDAKTGTEVRLAAIRATPHLREPERALGSLSLIVSTRDAVLAQAAARSVLAIVTALDVDQLARHEMLPAELIAVRVELERVAALEHVRADLRAMVRAAAGMLAGLGVASAD